MVDPVRALLQELVALRKQRASTTVVVQSEITTTLVLANGEIVSVRASKRGEPLGRLLVRKRLLKEEHYIDVLERMSSAMGVGEKVRFGELAIELGYTSEAVVQECLREQRRGLVARVFHGRAPSFERTSPEAGDGIVDKVPIEAAFLDAVRWMDETRKAALGLDASREQSLRLGWELEEIDSRFDLTPDEAEFVRVALAGDKTVSELLARRAADSVDPEAVLTALIASGAALPQPRGEAKHHPKSSRMRTAPPVEAKAVVDSTKAKNALAKISLASISLAKVSVGKMNAVDGAVEKQLRAEQALLRGKEFFTKGESRAALAQFERAATFAPESSEIDLFLRWSRHVVEEKPLDAAQRAELEQRARQALRDEPKLAFGYFVLGEVLRDGGKTEEGRRQLRHALRLDASLFDGVRSQRRDALRSSPETDEAPVSGVASAPANVEPANVGPARDAPARDVPAGQVRATPKAAPAAHPKRRPTMSWQFMSLVVLGTIGGLCGTIAYSRMSTPSPTTLAAAAPQVALPLRKEASVSVVNATIPVPAPVPSASVVAEPAAAEREAVPVENVSSDAGKTSSNEDSKSGTILLPKSAISHRVFVDGRVVVSEVGPDMRIVVPCGSHDVRVGSHGQVASVAVPCGGEVSLRR